MKDNKGFTLIEIMVVLLILSAFLFLAVPKFNEMSDVNIKSASRRFVATIRYLYNEAVFKKAIYRLNFSFETDEYWVDVLKGKEFIGADNPTLIRRKLPQGVRFKDVITARSNGSSFEDREEFILFFPNGFVEPAAIYLETESGHVFTLETKPYTGGVRVYDEFVELLRR